MATGASATGASVGRRLTRRREQSAVPRRTTEKIRSAVVAQLVRARTLDDMQFVVVAALTLLAVVMLGFVFDVAVVSGFEYRAAQAGEFSRLRNELAHGVAPVGDVSRLGKVLRPGAPVALLQVPSLHLSEVIVEGTTGENLTKGPGHLRNTVFPGQVGVSVVLGRSGAYGAPFGRLRELHKGDRINVTSGSGRTTFVVLDVRRAGDPVPAAPAASAARLVLVTAAGPRFLPSGLVRVDADSTTSGRPDGPLLVAGVPTSEEPLGTDTSTLWVLIFVLQALIIAVVGAVVSWRKWGRAQTWIVFVPLVLVLWYYASDQVMRLLPNLT